MIDSISVHQSAGRAADQTGQRMPSGLKCGRGQQQPSGRLVSQQMTAVCQRRKLFAVKAFLSGELAPGWLLSDRTL